MAMKEVCANCGEPTNLKTATAPRQKKGWCVDCFKYWQKNAFVDGSGKIEWRKTRSLYYTPPYGA